MSLFRIASVSAIGFAVWWFAFRVEGCGSAGALECRDKALDEGVGVTVPRAEACAAAGYYCFGRPESFQVVRWPLDKGKLKVRVTPPDFVTDQNLARKIRDAAVEGIREWDRQPFPLVIDTRKHAWPSWDIGMVWYQGGGGHARVRFEEKGKRLEFAIEGIQVMVPPAHWNLSEPDMLDMVRATAMHEMGHALGLMHSDAERDIMFPAYKPGVTPMQPSARDLRTVEALYALPNGAKVQ